MVDLEQCAHDLAILYIQAEINNGQIGTPIGDNLKDFVSLYQEHYKDILGIIEYC